MDGPQDRASILHTATHETELGDHDFCLSRSHYTDTDPTGRDRAATAGIEPGTSSPGVARSTVAEEENRRANSFYIMALVLNLIMLVSKKITSTLMIMMILKF